MASYCFTVFAGSKVGVRPEYLTAAKELGKALAERRCSLIYGGSSLGLLGAVAKSVEDHGGKVTGILPKFFAEREGHTAIGEEVLVEDLAARKVIMLEKSDGFIALPGGFGTLDEFFEVLVLRQLNQSKSPIGLLNVSNYYQHLTKLTDFVVDEGFAIQDHRNLFLVSDKPVQLVDMLIGNLKGN